MVRSSPRASAGFSRLAASPVPAAPPAPISVCASSMNRMTGTSEAWTSSITARRRFSNSPLTLAPACISPTSSIRRLTFCSIGGTSPWAMRSAKPSTTAVLPTPASPVRIGLFCRRRISTSTIWRISGSRPITGSILPARARSVRSVAYLASADCRPPGRAAARPAAGGSACAPARRLRSSRRARRRAAAPSASGSTLSNSRLILREQTLEHRHLERAEQDVGRAHRLVARLQRAVAQPSWIAWKTWSEKSWIEVAP